MINAKFDSKKFMKDMNNIIEYSFGFLDGVERGKQLFRKNIGEAVKELASEFIDANARSNPAMLHHIYEWSKTGSPEARLYDISYTVNGSGISFKSTFRQSTSIQNGSREPFYDKARIMENGIPITIKPRVAKVLAFTDNGEEIFTPNAILVQNPGGEMTTGGYEKVFDMFFSQYFSQSFLRASGLLDYLKDTSTYKTNLSSGQRMGRSKGASVGYRWIVNAGIIN
jgi:hypothetical protein